MLKKNNHVIYVPRYNFFSPLKSQKILLNDAGRKFWAFMWISAVLNAFLSVFQISIKALRNHGCASVNIMIILYLYGIQFFKILLALPCLMILFLSQSYKSLPRKYVNNFFMCFVIKSAILYLCWLFQHYYLSECFNKFVLLKQ